MFTIVSSNASPMVGLKAWLWEKHLLMKGSVSLNTTVNDLMSFLHCEHSLQKHRNFFFVSFLCVACFAFNVFSYLASFCPDRIQLIFFSVGKVKKKSLHHIRRPSSVKTDWEVAI